MGIADLLVLERIQCGVEISSKKRALEMLSASLATTHEELTEDEVFNGLLARERLGSTGLGHGVAIPHGRFKHVTAAFGAILTMPDGIDFDAVDGQPVNFIFALMVPEASTDEHLQLLSKLAELFRDDSIRAELVAAPSAESLMALFQLHSPSTVQAEAS